MGRDKDTQDLGWTSDRLENAISDPEDEVTAGPELVLDSNGYPLRPQPSSESQGKRASSA